MKYYTNNVKSFQLKRLQLAGDIHSNPGPPTAGNMKVKCQVHRIIVCDLCGLICQGRSKLDNWGGGADIHIYVFTHHKNNRFQKKLIVQNMNI